MLEILQEEILKLRALLRQKDARITALFRSLSGARACPLLSQEPEPDANANANHNHNAAENHRISLSPGTYSHHHHHHLYPATNLLTN